MDQLGERLRSELGGAWRYVLSEEECAYVHEMLKRLDEVETENEKLMMRILERLIDGIDAWEQAVKAIMGRDPRVPWDDLGDARGMLDESSNPSESV